MTDKRGGLSVTGLGKQFTTAAGELHVLRGIDLELPAGEALAITGPSGSGKSTLLHIVGTLERPSQGRVLLAGDDPFALTETELARFRNRRIGFVFQDHHLLPQYSALENVLIPTMAFADGAAPTAQARARELLERVGLAARLDHRPAELSGGERQRTAVARALVMNPGLILCDEPTGNLDRASGDAIADLLFELHESQNSMLIVVTHNEALAERFESRARFGSDATLRLTAE